jgi:DNA-binding transcriptional MerR regulator
MYTIGRLAEHEGISRSTLLYYDGLGLLSPSGRSASGYRLYSEENRDRLRKILAFRSLGLGLKDIGKLLGRERERPAGALLKRMFVINDEISGLRRQQAAILALLESEAALRVGRASLEALISIGEEAGISIDNYENIHAALEANSPVEHRRLLGLLGFSESEAEGFIEKLR